MLTQKVSGSSPGGGSQTQAKCFLVPQFGKTAVKCFLKIDSTPSPPPFLKNMEVEITVFDETVFEI